MINRVMNFAAITSGYSKLYCRSGASQNWVELSKAERWPGRKTIIKLLTGCLYLSRRMRTCCGIKDGRW